MGNAAGTAGRGDMNIALPVKVLRSACGMTQKDLAVKIGIDKSYLSLIEGGLREPSMGILECISTALNVQPYILMMMANPNDADPTIVGMTILKLMVQKEGESMKPNKKGVKNEQR